MIHNILGYWVGITGSIGRVDRVGLWTAITAVGTLALAGIAWVQLRAINKTSRADFIHKFTNNFFNQKTRNLIMFFEYDLLKFKTKKTDNDKYEYPYFELDKSRLEDITAIDVTEKAHTKQIYSAFEIDDDLLGYLDDIGNYEKEGLLDIKLIHPVFAWYITGVWENTEVKKYISWQMEDGEKAWAGLEYIYNKCKLCKK